jgi:hypothetical protein
MSHLRRLTNHIRPVFVALILAFMLAGSMVGLAMAQDPDDTPDEPPADTQPQENPSACGECHPDVIASWQGGPHDQAFSNQHFHDSWEDLDFQISCLECHTTGFSPATGQYEAEGVRCEACHGETPADHPPAPVNLDQANTVCGQCHTVTQAEFRASQHAEVGLQCTSCHYAHTNGLRMGTELQQCLNCHGDELGGFVAHTTHIENGLSCRDCHGYVRPGQPIPADGLAPTGHDFQENIVACLDCHEDIQLEAVDGEGEGGPSELAPEDLAELDGQQAVLRARQLEGAVQTLLVQNRNQSTMNIIEGAAGGLLVGGIVVWLLTRRRNGSGMEVQMDDEMDDEEEEHEA